MHIYTLRGRSPSWVALLAACLGAYLVLAIGYRLFVQPILVKSSEAAASKPPPAMFMAYRDRGLAEPATSGQSLRSVAPPSSSQARQPLVSTSEAPAASTGERDAIAAPKKPSKKKVARRAHDRSLQRTADRHSPFFNFRPWF